MTTIIRAARTVSVRRERAVIASLAIIVLALLALSLCVGQTNIPLGDVLRVLSGHVVPGASFAIGELRLPRALDATLVGLAFGMSGTIFQTLLRNVLASPDVIGVSSGASAAAVIGITVFGVSGLALSAVALLGALLAATLMYALAWRGGVSPYRLVLIGIGIAAMLQAVIGYVITRISIGQVQDVLIWLTGSLNRSLWNQFPALAGSLALLVPLAAVLGRPFRGLQLGDDTASGLGISPERSRLALILVAVALAAVATAAAGPVAFVALLSGPIALRLTRGAGPALFAAGLVGAAIVLTSDFVGQNLTGTRFPVGVVTGIIGAPYLVWMLAAANRGGKSA